MCQLRKKASEGRRRRRSIMLKVATKTRKVNSKTTTLHLLHPKLPTSTLLSISCKKT